MTSHARLIYNALLPLTKEFVDCPKTCVAICESAFVCVFAVPPKKEVAPVGVVLVVVLVEIVCMTTVVGVGVRFVATVIVLVCVGVGFAFDEAEATCCVVVVGFV